MLWYSLFFCVCFIFISINVIEKYEYNYENSKLYKGKLIISLFLYRKNYKYDKIVDYS